MQVDSANMHTVFVVSTYTLYYVHVHAAIIFNRVIGRHLLVIYHNILPLGWCQFEGSTIFYLLGGVRLRAPQYFTSWVVSV